MNPYAILSGTLVALAAIASATVAVVHGSIDGSAFSAIIGAAIGGVSVVGGTVIANGGGSNARRPASE